VVGLFTAPVDEHPGGPQGIMLVLHDLTEAERTERIRREFVANASHELRTPIAAIKIMVESLLDGAQEDADTRSRFLNLVEREADRLTGLVNDLLDLSQMDAGQWPLEFVEFPLRETLEPVLAKLQVVAAEKRQQLAGKCHPDARVWGDKRAVYQILSNLISNAIRYSPEEGEISITAETRGAVTRIRVRDTGIGIPKEDRERIFERFFRIDRARAREQGGSGLGLAIVKYLVEAQGGRVTVSSAPGKGSLFTVVLPARALTGKSGEEEAPACGTT
jgi:signal transduction histidine kinase